MDSVLSKPQVSATHRNDLLKIVALITMLIDHTGYLFFTDQMWLRTIGRIAFPIFAYQVAIGFQKTSSRKAYASRLLIFAIISQIPYLWFNPELNFEFFRLNIMFTLLISLGVMHAFEQMQLQFKEFGSQRSPLHLLKWAGWLVVFTALIVLPEVSRYKFDMGIEYGSVGTLLVLMFYLFGGKFWTMLLGYLAISALGIYDSAVRRYYYNASKSWIEAFLDFKTLWKINMVYDQSFRDLSGIFFQSRSIIALPFIWGCNWIERLGMINIRLNKYVGYFFYPVHITILLGIKYFLLS